VELDFWNGFTGGAAAPIIRNLIERFNSEHDNIKVSMNVIEWEEYYQKVPTAISVGRGPDLGIAHVDTLGTLAVRQAIIPIESMAEAMGLRKGDYPALVWESGIYNGRRYGIPLDVHPLGFYYNKGTMEKAGLDPDEPPQTKDEYMAALEELKGAGIRGSWVSPFLFTGTLQFESLLWQFGGDLYDEDVTKATFNSDAGVEALTWMVDLVKDGYSPKDVAQDAEYVAFQNGDNAFMWNGIWNITAFQPLAELEWDVAPLPQIGSERAAWTNAHNFVVMRQAKPDKNKLVASNVFIDWLVEHSVEWATTGHLPTAPDARESAEFKKLQYHDAFVEELPYVHFLPSTAGIDAVRQESYVTAVNEAVLLNKGPKPALDAAAERANQLLEENRQRYQT
jgi:multiple sugar transport system substrate-binding protein